jgi:hypothetical protein
MINRPKLLVALFVLTQFVAPAQNRRNQPPPPPREAVPGGKLVPPATPLVANDPYFSVWSPADRLTDATTTHWTGKPQPLSSVAKIDGKMFRVMGKTPEGSPALTQKSLDVLPTRTIYTFEEAGLTLTLTFMTPALPYDIDILSRPVTYVIYDWKATDGKKHEVRVGFAASGLLAVNTPDQEVNVKSQKINGLATATLNVLRIGSVEQGVLAKKGDDIRIDWGYFYMATSSALEIGCFARPDSKYFLAADEDGRSELSERNTYRADGVVAEFETESIQVSAKPVTQWLMLAYDDLYSIQYMRKNLRPYWRRKGWEAADLLKASAREFESLRKRCAEFDAELMAD